MANKYLDTTGLSYFWAKLKGYFVAKETGKGLSSNDFTTTLKDKLDGIAVGAEANVQSDWSQSSSSADDYIKNKPTTIAGYGITDAKIDNGTITLGSATMTPLTSHQSVVNSGPTLAWETESTVGTVGGTALKVTMPANPNTDTKNTAGSTDSSSKLFIVGATSQSASPQTYSHDTAYVGTDGCLYSNSSKVVTVGDKGVASGIASLDSNGKVPSSQLPSFVDDVIEAYARDGQTALSSTWLATGSASGTVITPEAGKIYVLMADSGDYSANSQFRWGGSAYVKLNDGGVSPITNTEIDTIVAS